MGPVAWMVLFLCGGLQAAGGKDYVSRVGRRVLVRTSWAGTVRILRTGTFRGASVAQVAPRTRWYGTAGGRRWLVFAGTPGYFGRTGTEMVLFLAALGSGQFRAVARLRLTGPADRARAALLREVLAVDTAPAPAAERARRLKELCCRRLGEAALRAVALAELGHLVRRWRGVFNLEDRARFRALLEARPALAVRRHLRALVRALAGPSDPAAAWGARFRAAPTPAARLSVVAEARQRLGPRALPLLAAALRDGEPAVRERAAYELGLLGDPVAVPLLLARLDRESRPACRAAVAEALGRLGAAEAVAVLAALAREPGVAPAAVRALGELGTPAARRTLEELARALGTRADPEGAALRRLIRFVLRPEFRAQEERLRRLERGRS